MNRLTIKQVFILFFSLLFTSQMLLSQDFRRNETKHRLKTCKSFEIQNNEQILQDSLVFSWSGNNFSDNLQYSIMSSYEFDYLQPTEHNFLAQNFRFLEKWEIDRFDVKEIYSFSDQYGDDIQRVKTTFDFNGNVTKKEFQTFDNDEFTTWTIEEFEYNENNDLTVYYNLYYDASTKEYVYNYPGKYEFEYDNDGNVIQVNVFESLDNSWENFNKYEYKYDEDGNLIERKTSYWEDGFDFIKSDSAVYLIENNVLNEIERYGWKASEQKWEIYTKIEFEYDANKNMTSNSEYWSFDGTKWGSIYKGDYTYNQEGLITTLINSNYYDGEWSIDGKTEYEYKNGGQSKSTRYYWDEYYFPTLKSEFEVNNVGLPIRAQVFEMNDIDKEWIGKKRVLEFYYEEFELEEEDTPTNSITKNENNIALLIYPNPATDILSIEAGDNKMKKITITDLNGKTVFETLKPVNSSFVNIEVSELKQGIYFVHIQLENGVSKSKFIIE